MRISGEVNNMLKEFSASIVQLLRKNDEIKSKKLDLLDIQRGMLAIGKQVEAAMTLEQFRKILAGYAPSRRITHPELPVVNFFPESSRLWQIHLKFNPKYPDMWLEAVKGDGLSADFCSEHEGCAILEGDSRAIGMRCSGRLAEELGTLVELTESKR